MNTMNLQDSLTIITAFVIFQNKVTEKKKRHILWLVNEQQQQKRMT